jgi:hypothetical protein
MAAVLTQSLPTFVDFAEAHDYDVVVGSGDDSRGRPTSWGKVRLMRRLLDRYDVVLWVDADAIILDNLVDPAELLGPGDFQGLVLLHQFDQELPCCGVWLLRSTPKAKSFLDEIWQKEEFIHDRFWEQAAAMDLLGFSIRPSHLVEPSEWMTGTVWLGEEWDCLPLISRTLSPCRIRHYGGETNKVRRRQMKTDRHGLSAQTTQGWRRTWHLAAAALGALRWRLWDAPRGTFGSYSRLKYRATNQAYDVARAIGFVRLVRAMRHRPTNQVGTTTEARPVTRV